MLFELASTSESVIFGLRSSSGIGVAYSLRRVAHVLEFSSSRRVYLAHTCANLVPALQANGSVSAKKRDRTMTLEPRCTLLVLFKGRLCILRLRCVNALLRTGIFFSQGNSKATISLMVVDGSVWVFFLNPERIH